jgi:Tat protein translocase TatB subunit
MFDIGWMEMAVIVIIALLVVGPRELPRVIRSVNEWLARARALAREFKAGLDDIANQTDLAALKTDMEGLAAEANTTIEGTMLDDPAGASHDFSIGSDHDDYWNDAGGAWRYVEPGDGAKKNPKRHKKARLVRLKPRRGAHGARPKVRT